MKKRNVLLTIAGLIVIFALIWNFRPSRTLDELMGVTIQDYEEIACRHLDGYTFTYNEHFNQDLLPELRDVLSSLEVRYDSRVKDSIISCGGEGNLYCMTLWSSERNLDAEFWLGEGDEALICFNNKYYEVTAGSLGAVSDLINNTTDFVEWGTAYGEVQESLSSADKAAKIIEDELEDSKAEGFVKDYEITSFTIKKLEEDMDSSDSFTAFVEFDVEFDTGEDPVRISTQVELPMLRTNSGFYENRNRERVVFASVKGDTARKSFIGAAHYVASIDKKDVSGKSRGEITELLMNQWLGYAKNWERNGMTFVLTDWKITEVGDGNSTNEFVWDGTTDFGDRKPLPPTAIESWLTWPTFSYKFIGFDGNMMCTQPLAGAISYDEEVWTETLYQGTLAGMLLIEWEDKWTLETIWHCLDSFA